MADFVDLKEKKSSKKIFNLVVWISIALIALFIIANTLISVQAGHTGVIVTFGKVEDIVFQEGLHVKVPFVQQVVQVDNRIMKSEVQCSNASKDLQTVSSTIALNYSINKTSSAKVYRNIGMDYEAKIINPSIIESVKSATAKFTAEELITKRQNVSDIIKQDLLEKLAPYGFNIDMFNITSFDFSEEFNAAIEAKQTAQQNALKAEQDLQRIKVEAQQQIEQAKAEAEAYKLKSQEITPQMIQMEYINKWDGKLPAVVSDGTNLMDISGMVGSENTDEPVYDGAK